MPERNGDFVGSFAPRPKYHASHGTTVVTYGTPAASAASATGFTTSGVDVASMRSTPCPWMRSFATFAACAGADWLSRSTICTAYRVPPTSRPFANAFLASEMTYGSGSPKPDAAPVSGLTKPSLIVFAALPNLPAHAELATAGAAATPPTTTTLRLTNSRRVRPVVSLLPLSLPTAPPCVVTWTCARPPRGAAHRGSGRGPLGPRARSRG